MKTVFQFRTGSHISGDAQIVGERLEAIRARAGNLTPELVLRDARNIRSVLHEHFEWDDTVAAERYRLDQAGHLIRSVQVEYMEAEQAQERQISLVASSEPSARVTRAFVAVVRDGGRGYESTERAMADPELRRQVLERAHGELNAIARKYKEVSELADVFAALDRVGALVAPQRQAA